jgi:hypothetical protein
MNRQQVLAEFDREQVLAEYDREQRIEIEFPDIWQGVAPRT